MLGWGWQAGTPRVGGCGSQSWTHPCNGQAWSGAGRASRGSQAAVIPEDEALGLWDPHGPPSQHPNPHKLPQSASQVLEPQPQELICGLDRGHPGRGRARTWPPSRWAPPGPPANTPEHPAPRCFAWTLCAHHPSLAGFSICRPQPSLLGPSDLVPLLLLYSASSTHNLSVSHGGGCGPHSSAPTSRAIPPGLP